MARMARFIPYSGTFLTFTDLLRPVDRAVSADGPARFILCDDPDSIGLGEDGHATKPVEHVWPACAHAET